MSPLVRFLRQTRSGHCEYFATATALLLRAAGVPTRYAVGYSVGEQRGKRWIARGRDAHAWCLAHVEGRWEEVDTTPGSWREREAAGVGRGEGLRDAFSEAWYRFALWRQQGGNWRIYVFAASMVALGWLAWRQLRGSRWRRSDMSRAGRRSGQVAGLDSNSIRWRGTGNGGTTTAGTRDDPGLDRAAWARGGPSEFDPEAVLLHYRLRFDPRPPADRAGKGFAGWCGSWRGALARGLS
jgi:hypothetical protein